MRSECHCVMCAHLADIDADDYDAVENLPHTVKAILVAQERMLSGTASPADERLVATAAARCSSSSWRKKYDA